MREAPVSAFLTMVWTISTWNNWTEEQRARIYDDGEKELFLRQIVEWDEFFGGMGFTTCRASLSRVRHALQEPEAKYGDVIVPSNELIGRLNDYVRYRNFFSLTQRESDLFTQPRAGWGLGIERFPDIVDDVEEASKCFALSRYSAAVFHTVQISEAGLVELGKFLQVADPLPGWTSTSQALSKVIKKDHRERSQFERENFQFLAQAQGTVEGLKNAWRNKISHAQGKLVLMTKEFSPEVAEEIFFATRAFIRRLAEGLPPREAKEGEVGITSNSEAAASVERS
jgi:hypothetical protein